MVYSSFLVFSVGATYRPLDGQGCHSHWMCGGGTPWDVQWSACLLPRGTEPGSCNDTAFSPIWGLTARWENPQTHKHTHTHTQEQSLITEGSWRQSRNGLMGGELNRSFSPLTTSLSVRFWKSPCSWIRTRTVYLPASSSATSRITREFPSMWYLEHCSAATLPSFNLSEEKKKRTLSKVWWGESK